MENLVRDMGGVDVLVYNSGVGIYNKKLDFVPEKGTIPVNVTGFVDMPMTKQNK